MRILTKDLVGSLVLSMLVIIICVSGFAGDQPRNKEISSSLHALDRSFVARLISFEPDEESAFITHLADCNLPVWNEFISLGILSGVAVFELTNYDTSVSNISVREYLILAELSSETAPDDFLNAEKEFACKGSRKSPAFSIMRSAIMSCTPNSCFGMPEPTYEDRAAGIDFLIEFIGVEETPSSLGKYRELMSNYFGPANEILVERGMLHCFVALENIEVLSDSPKAVPWNQIHISDDWDEGGEIDWDSVYVELFQNEFSCDLDSIWAELPPTYGTRADYHGRLISKLFVR